MSIPARTLSAQLPQIMQLLQQRLGTNSPFLRALQQQVNQYPGVRPSATPGPNIVQVAPISDPIIQSRYAPFTGALPTVAAVNPWGPNNHMAYDNQGDLDMRMALGGAGAQMPVSAPITPTPTPPRPIYPGPTGPGGPANPVPTTPTPTPSTGGQVPGGYWNTTNDVWRRIPSSQRAYPAGFSNYSTYFDDREEQPWGYSVHVPRVDTPPTPVATPVYSPATNLWRARTNRPTRWA